jgi:hypothetical protein
MPEGACGLRIAEAEVLEYYWADYNAFALGSPMPNSPFGPPNSTTNPPGVALEPLIEFTGPYGENCGEETVFHAPLTGDYPTFANGTPQGAGALVFQALPGEVVWLTEQFNVWEPEEDPGQEEDPDFVSVCELFPDMCVEPGFTTEDPCNSNIFDCGYINQNIYGFKQSAVQISRDTLALQKTFYIDTDKESSSRTTLETSLKGAEKQFLELSSNIDGIIATLARTTKSTDNEQRNKLNVMQRLTRQSLDSCKREISTYQDSRNRTEAMFRACNTFETNVEFLSHLMKKVIATR